MRVFINVNERRRETDRFVAPSVLVVVVGSGGGGRVSPPAPFQLGTTNGSESTAKLQPMRLFVIFEPFLCVNKLKMTLLVKQELVNLSF